MADNPLIPAALSLQEALEQTGCPYCLIGGIAVQRWGEPRVTEDADAVVFTDLTDEDRVIAALLDRFEPRIPDAASFARVQRVLLMQDPTTGVALDVSLGAFDYDRGAMQRASEDEYAEGVRLRTCSAEDLIVYKAFAAREIDWHDIRGILIRQQGRLDLGLIERELRPLVDLKEDPDIWPRWEALRDRYRLAE